MVYYILCGCIPVLLLQTDCNSIDLPGWETDLNWKCLASSCPPSWLRPIYSPHLTVLGHLPSPRPPTFFYKPLSQLSTMSLSLQSLFPKHQPFTSPSSGASVVHFLLHSFSSHTSYVFFSTSMPPSLHPLLFKSHPPFCLTICIPIITSSSPHTCCAFSMGPFCTFPSTLFFLNFLALTTRCLFF